MKSADLVPYLTSLRGTAWLAGQQLPSDDRTPTPAQLMSGMPVPPAIIGANVPVGDTDAHPVDAAVQKILTAHAQLGGIIELCWHPPNWFGSITDISGAWVSNVNAPKPDLTTLLSGTSTARAKYLRYIQRLIAYIKTLPPDAVVIVRAYHEAGGTWFAWGRDVTNPARSEAGVKAIWVDTMRQIKAACPNVLGAFSGAMAWFSPILYGYPGSMVDVVGTSLYSSTVEFANGATDYNDLVTTGKPVVLFEFGPDPDAAPPAGWDSTQLLTAMATRYPKLVGAIAWLDNNSWSVMSNSSRTLADPRVIVRSELAPAQPTGWVFADHNPGRIYAAPNGSATVRYPVY